MKVKKIYAAIPPSCHGAKNLHKKRLQIIFKFRDFYTKKIDKIIEIQEFA